MLEPRAAHRKLAWCGSSSRLCSASCLCCRYCTDQSHSSVAKAAAVAGMRPSQVCVLPTTASESDAAASHTMSSDVLRQAIAKDVDGGTCVLVVWFPTPFSR